MKSLITLLLFAAAFTAQAQQNISVASFRALPYDMHAQIDYPKTDQNGERCAIIKVQTTETDFVWEPGLLGIVKVEKKAGEWWLYVPHKSRRITIKHPKLGVLRDYIYPEPIQKACVYELVLTTGKVVTTVIEPEIQTQWVVITSTPEGADVYIDEVYMGVTPFNKKMAVGSYNYRLEKNWYHNSVGKMQIINEGKKKINDVLDPAFGYAKITTTPESGAKITIDGEETNAVTPYTTAKIKSGKHRVIVKKSMYQPVNKEITITDGQTADIIINMPANFANVTINTTPKADIYIDAQKVGNGSYTGTLSPGIHDFEAKKDNHSSHKTQKETKIGETHTINLTVQPKQGSLDVISSPIEADITLNGKSYGTTPNTLSNLLVGEYTLKLSKTGYAPITKTVTITENSEAVINETLALPTKQITTAKASKNTKLYNEENTLTDSRDNRTYKTVKIGSQTWMAENLAYKTNSGCWAYDNNENNVSKYGRLYNWKTAKKACPSGWRLPSDAEWKQLEMHLGMSQSEANDTGYRGTNEGSKLKATSGWYNKGNGTNESGFTAVQGGYRGSNGAFYLVGYSGSWWSSTEFSTPTAYYRDLYYDRSNVSRDYYGYGKECGFSVRCVRGF